MERRTNSNSRNRRTTRIVLNNDIKKVFLILIYLIIVCTILVYAKNYIKDSGKLKLLINSDDVSLKYEAFIKNGSLYMSVDDIDNYFGAKTYSEKNKDGKDTVISMSGNKILRLIDGEKIYEINNTTQKIGNNFENRNGIYYLPVSDIMATYNVQIEEYDNNTINVELLNKEKRVAKAKKRVKVKYKETIFSKNVDKVRKNEQVIVVKDNKKWTKIMTNDGHFGYVKTKYLEKEEVIREVFDGEITNKKENNKVVEIKNEDIKGSRDNITKSYDPRKAFILNIVDGAVKKKFNAVEINFNNIKNVENYYRFLTELRPYLNEYSISLIVVKKDELSESRLKNIVNQIK